MFGKEIRDGASRGRASNDDYGDVHALHAHASLRAADDRSGRSPIGEAKERSGGERRALPSFIV